MHERVAATLRPARQIGGERDGISRWACSKRNRRYFRPFEKRVVRNVASGMLKARTWFETCSDPLSPPVCWKESGPTEDDWEE